MKQQRGTDLNSLSHFRANDAEAANVSKDAHGNIAVGHTAVDFQMLEVGPRVQLHTLDHGTGLKSVGFQSSTRDVRRVGV